MNEWAYIGVAVCGLGLAAVAIRNISNYSGKKLLLYVLSLVVLGTLGALIGHNAEAYHWPVGLAVGLGLVELGPTLTTALKSETKKRLGKVFDRFSPERDSGYSGDSEDGHG